MKGISKVLYRNLQLKKERKAQASLLSEGSPETLVKVIHVIGGSEARRKLFDMGIVPGEKLKVLKNERKGPILVSFHGGTIMIGRGLAEKVRITQD